MTNPGTLLHTRTGRVFIGFVFSTLPLLAQESGGSGEGTNVILWQALNFVILAGLLGWLAVKQGGPALRARGEEIRSGLAAGEKAKAEADARAAQVQAQLANLGKEVEEIRASAKEERDREADRIRRDTQAEMDRIRVQADNEIESAGKMARLEVQHAAARMAIDLAEKKVRARMSPEIQMALLQGFLADLPRNGAVHNVE
jgi:F-type H+-transporting ATPase subunit b